MSYHCLSRPQDSVSCQCQPLLVRARSVTVRLLTPVLRALTWDSSYSEGDSRRSSCAISPTQFAHFTFPISGNVLGPIHFPLDLIPSPLIL